MSTVSAVMEHEEVAGKALAAALSTSPPRRFFIPDLDRHPWLVDRLVKLYNINERQVISWLRSLTESSEFLFLYSDNAVGLAEVTRQHTLAASPVLTVRFVWCRPPSQEATSNKSAQDPVEIKPAKELIAEAVLFFDEFAKWAKNKNITTIVLEDDVLDVPREMIRETKSLGRLFKREQWFAKVT